MFQNLQISLHEQIKWNINKPVVLIVFLLCNTIDLSWEGFFLDRNFMKGRCYDAAR